VTGIVVKVYITIIKIGEIMEKAPTNVRCQTIEIIVCTKAQLGKGP